MKTINWDSENILWIANDIPEGIDDPKPEKLRSIIEPWLTAVFQSEHLSLLLGTGITTATVFAADESPTAMERIEFDTCKEQIKDSAERTASLMDRGTPNFEDDLRTAIELLKGLEILDDSRKDTLKEEIDSKLEELVKGLLENEYNVRKSDKYYFSFGLLKRFLTSFSSRTATRDRLHIFTTNYDRFIEETLDQAGIYTLDRFVGKLKPIMRMHQMELDYHYNPPGIRGEPRYVEGVVRYTKLHGSLDWRIKENDIIKHPHPFGRKLKNLSNSYNRLVVYPNSAKALDTAYFPYSELFRDFSSATCRPNSVLITYGYGFGDSHINNIILDMMSINSTHLVIISYDKADGRIERFVEHCNPSQLTLIIGSHFGELQTLVENYLPKSAIDRISNRQAQLLERRRWPLNNNSESDQND